MSNIRSRKPGRPPGSTRYRDGDHAMLARVADIIADDPTIRPTTALRQLRVEDDSVLHRLRRKWRASDAYLIEARARRRERFRIVNERAVAEAVGRVGSFLRNIDPAVLERMHETSLGISRAIVTAGISVARWADQNPEMIQRIRQAALVLHRSDRQTNTAIAGVMLRNPNLFRN